MRQNLENLLLILVGLAIVAALAWLTTRALEPVLEPQATSEPTPEPAASRVPTLTIVPTARAKPTKTRVPATPVPSPRPTLSLPREIRPSPALPPPTAIAPRSTPTRAPEPRPSPASSIRWSAPREYRVESPAKLHERPDPASHVIARLRPGTIVTVVAEQGGWLRVESTLGRRAGWLEAERLRPTGGRR